MDCPICGAVAQNISPTEFEGLVVVCRHCGTFEVSDEALNSLIRLDFDGRKAELDKAKQTAPQGSRPVIR